MFLRHHQILLRRFQCVSRVLLTIADLTLYFEGLLNYVCSFTPIPKLVAAIAAAATCPPYTTRSNKPYLQSVYTISAIPTRGHGLHDVVVFYRLLAPGFNAGSPPVSHCEEA